MRTKHFQCSRTVGSSCIKCTTRSANADRALAERVKEKRLRGYHDVRVGHDPDERNLPLLLAGARVKFDEKKELLEAYAQEGGMGYGGSLCLGLGVGRGKDRRKLPMGSSMTVQMGSTMVAALEYMYLVVFAPPRYRLFGVSK